MPPPLITDEHVTSGLGEHAFGLVIVLIALGIVGLGASILGHEHIEGSTVTMLYLGVVLWGGLSFGRVEAVTAALVGTLASNYFFFVPYNAFGFDTLRDAITLSVFLITAITTSNLAARVREESERRRQQAEIAEATSRELAVLYEVGQRLAPLAGVDDLIEVVNRDFLAILSRPVHLELENGNVEPAEGEAFLLPLKTVHGALGTLAFKLYRGETLSENVTRLYTAIGEQVAMGLERAKLSEEMAESRLLADGEKLRTALLNSITHDFRTPLSSIIGGASSLLSSDGHFSEQARQEQLAVILQSAQRLNRYIGNLLDYTNIESGGIRPKTDWVDIADVINAALESCEPVLAEKHVALDLPSDLPLLRVDASMIERVFINLIENAAKYSPRDSGIEIAFRQVAGSVEARFYNLAEIPLDMPLEYLFKRRYRDRASERRGAGLGLSICRSFVVAHGAAFEVERERQGLVFILRFPIERMKHPEGALDD
ncbi:MAG: DUF4118 domain-containing protein [Rhodospirillales bacterium]|nr:MAG: DUF4118 domain-containing protein [Rhodospirillales bacterium]